MEEVAKLFTASHQRVKALKLRCTGKYDKRSRMQRALRSTSWKRNREFQPWKNKWHFFSYKDYGHWLRGEAGKDFAKRSVLYRSGRELVRLDVRKCGCRSLINHPSRFHPNKHWVDFHVWISEYGNEQEFGISCDLDGVYTIDHVSGNWVNCQLKGNGRWSCSECYDTGYSGAEPGYVKATFDSKQALLLDHLKPTMEGIRYLCSHNKVEVWLSNPNDIGNSSSAVMLRCDATDSIPIGKVMISPLKSSTSRTAQWIIDRLTAELQQVRNEHSMISL